MERLRRLQLRGPSTAKTSATALPQKVIVTTQRSADLGRDVKVSTSNKAQSRHHEGALDLEVLNSKLQQYAQTCNRDEEDDDAEEGSAKEPCRVPGVITKESQGTEVIEVETRKKSTAVKEGADSAFEHVSGATSRQSSQTRASTCPSIVIHPPDDEQPAEPSDFQLFLQKAEDDERTRKEQGLPALPKSKQESSVNPFYSNNLANPSSVPPKLAEIQETGDEEGEEVEEQQQQDSPAEEASDQTVSTQRTASSSASSGSNDFAATETQPTTRLANTTSLGRHVSFCEPQKLRDRSDSHGSAYHARGFESPKALREVTKRRSFRKMVTSYIRHR